MKTLSAAALKTRAAYYADLANADDVCRASTAAATTDAGRGAAIDAHNAAYEAVRASYGARTLAVEQEPGA